MGAKSKIKQICLMISLLVCSYNRAMSQGIEYINDTTVLITLSELESDTIPNVIWSSMQIVELKIQKTRPQGRWESHPPLSWYENRELTPPYWSLPNKLGNLENLEFLYLSNLDINELPNSITNLSKLRILDLSLNKLRLTDELDKLKKLKNLDELRLLGNHYEAGIMEEFKKEFADIEIEYAQNKN